MSKHTPGPHRVEAQGNGGKRYIVGPRGEALGCAFRGEGRDGNAALWASAAEMLEALRALEAACSERDEHCRPVPTDHPARIAARAAISKAEGK